MIIRDGNDDIKYQITCYRIFVLLVIGDCSLTTGIIRRAKKFGFSICFMTYSFRFYGIVNSGLEGNTYLHEKQYRYDSTELARILIYNKVLNQCEVLKNIRSKSDYIKEGVTTLTGYAESLRCGKDMDRASIMGIEGNASRVYFPRLFYDFQWKSRRPRIKNDYINALLDIGYTILFNFVDALLHVYDFDVFKGVLHTCFYQRKSLVCDIMEPFRPLVDWRVRKGIKLKQFKKEDFIVVKEQYQLEYKKSAEYVTVFMGDILKKKEAIFVYIRSYYRAFMKGRQADLFPIYDISKGMLDSICGGMECDTDQL